MGFLKFKYYVKNVFLDVIPRSFFSKNTKYNEFNNLERIDYYNKLEDDYSLINYVSLEKFKRPKKLKTYYFDTIEILRFYSKDKKIQYRFGDVTKIPKEPSFVKSRPIDGNNKNSILLKLNKVRHFNFVNDKINFKDKKNILVGRTKIFSIHQNRIEFYNNYYNNSMCNLGAINSSKLNTSWQADKMSIKEHLQYKFVLSLEGNDVATNLKWIMSSNSIAVSPKLKFETWFMEGTLIPGYHFICIKDDYSDLEDKLNYYMKNTDEALQIIKNANAYVEQFKDLKKEKRIAHGVVDKYFKLQN